MNDIVSLSDLIVAKEMSKAKLVDHVANRIEYLMFDVKKLQAMLKNDDAIDLQAELFMRDVKRLETFVSQLNGSTSHALLKKVSLDQVNSTLGAVEEHPEELYGTAIRPKD